MFFFWHSLLCFSLIFALIIASFGTHIALNEIMSFRCPCYQCARTVNPNHAHYMIIHMTYAFTKFLLKFSRTSIVNQLKHDPLIMFGNLDAMFFCLKYFFGESIFTMNKL